MKELSYLKNIGSNLSLKNKHHLITQLMTSANDVKNPANDVVFLFLLLTLTIFYTFF